MTVIVSSVSNVERNLFKSKQTKSTEILLFVLDFAYLSVHLLDYLSNGRTSSCRYSSIQFKIMIFIALCEFVNKQYAIHRTVRQEVVDDTKYVCFYAANTVYYKSFLRKENLNSIPLSWKHSKP